MINQIKNYSNEKMKMCIENFQIQINNIRTGRASPELLHSIKIDYFGSRVPLKNISAIIVENFNTLKINVFDESNITLIKKSILNSNLNLNPVVYGKSIIVPIPSLTEERRKDLIKVARSSAENARICIRNIRKNANDKIKSCLKNKTISKDNEYTAQNNIQKITDECIKKIDNILFSKEKELINF